MRVSHKYKFIFLANPRTGSTSVRKVLEKYSDIKSIHVSEISKANPFYHHISAKELKCIFDETGWDWFEYKRFCFVRNPFSRVVSLYHHDNKLSAKKGRERKLSSKLTEKFKMIFHKNISFRTYVKSININNRLTTGLKEFIADDKGNILVDDILLFEELESALPIYLRKLGLNIADNDIPHLNASITQLPYRSYYNRKSIEYVRNLYSYEIERFNYKF